MFRGFRIGRCFGIPVYVNWSLLIAAGLFTYILATAELPTAAPNASGVVYFLAAAMGAVIFFASVAAHELSHSVVAQRNGVNVEKITLWLLGGVAQLSGRVRTAGAQFRIAIAGPLMSVFLGGVFALVAWGMWALRFADVAVATFIWLAAVNFVLAVFNMIPAAPLDGGRVLASALWAIWRNKARAEGAAATVGLVFGWSMAAFGIIETLTGGMGLWFVLLGWFVIAVAGAERRAAKLEATVGDALVRDVMNPNPVTVPGWITVEHFWSSPPLGDHHAYPVARWEGGVHGIARVDHLALVPPHMRAQMRVADFAEAAAEAAPDEPLVDVVTRAGGPLVLVIDQGRLLGVITAEDLTAARDGRHQRPAPTAG